MGAGLRAPAEGGLRLRLFPASCVSMPVHAHFADLAVARLAEDRPACVHPVTGAAAAEGATELRREPRARLEHFAGAERNVGLRERQILPVVADRADAGLLLAERRFHEYGVGGEHGADLVHVRSLPALTERVEQLAVGFVHRPEYSPIRNPRSRRR